MKSLASWVITGAVSLFAVGGVAMAFSGSAQFGMDTCNNCVLNATGEASESLGAGTPNRVPNGYMDTAYGYYVDGVQIIGDSGAVSSTAGTFTSLSATTMEVTTFSQGGSAAASGSVRATSTTALVVPLLASDFDTENVIDVTLNTGSGVLSFPATSTLTDFIPSPGQTRTIYIRNATTTATTGILVTGGTGVLLKVASSSPALISPDTDGSNYGVVTLIRKADSDIEALFSMFKDSP